MPIHKSLRLFAICFALVVVGIIQFQSSSTYATELIDNPMPDKLKYTQEKGSMVDENPFCAVGPDPKGDKESLCAYRFELGMINLASRGVQQTIFSLPCTWDGLRIGDIVPIGNNLYKITKLKASRGDSWGGGIEFEKVDPKIESKVALKEKYPWVVTPRPKNIHFSYNIVGKNREQADNWILIPKLYLKQTSVIEEKGKKVEVAEFILQETLMHPDTFSELDSRNKITWYSATVREGDHIVFNKIGLKVLNVVVRDEKKKYHPWVELQRGTISEEEVVKQKIVGVPLKKLDSDPFALK